MNPVIDDSLEKRLGLDALAHEATLHVREGDDDGVDAPVSNHLAQLVELPGDGVARTVAGGGGGAVLVAHRILLSCAAMHLGAAGAPLADIVALAERGGQYGPPEAVGPAGTVTPLQAPLTAPKRLHLHTRRAALDRTVADFESPPRSARGPSPARPD